MKSNPRSLPEYMTNYLPIFFIQTVRLRRSGERQRHMKKRSLGSLDRLKWRRESGRNKEYKFFLMLIFALIKYINQKLIRISHERRCRS